MLTVFYLKNDVSSNTTILAFNSLNLKIRTLQKRKKKRVKLVVQSFVFRFLWNGTTRQDM